MSDNNDKAKFSIRDNIGLIVVIVVVIVGLLVIGLLVELGNNNGKKEDIKDTVNEILLENNVNPVFTGQWYKNNDGSFDESFGFIFDVNCVDFKFIVDGEVYSGVYDAEFGVLKKGAREKFYSDEEFFSYYYVVLNPNNLKKKDGSVVDFNEKLEFSIGLNGTSMKVENLNTGEKFDLVMKDDDVNEVE